MASSNRAVKRASKYTYEGAVASNINDEQQLRRLAMAHLLWEDTFYVDGKEAAGLLAEAIKNVRPEKVARIAIEARTQMKLRHVPLFIVREMARLDSHKRVVADTLYKVIQRADELTEFLALYWKGKDANSSISAQVKKGLARAFGKFNEYALAKYNREGAVKLKDVLFLVHAKPESKAQADLWKRLIDGKLETPDTWEVALSATKGVNKREEWQRLLHERKLPALALLRNLRNMREAGVPGSLIKEALSTIDVSRVLPFRFIAAAAHNPTLESSIEDAMLLAARSLPQLPGRTALVVDNSGSMRFDKVSKRSELERIDAACALAIMAREMCEDVVIIGFGNEAKVLPDRRGFGLRDVIKNGPGGGTETQTALNLAARQNPDRIILITDEQSHQRVSPPPPGVKGYVMNVANYKNGIGYGSWVHMDGWSEALLQFIAAHEGIGGDWNTAD